MFIYRITMGFIVKYFRNKKNKGSKYDGVGKYKFKNFNSEKKITI